MAQKPKAKGSKKVQPPNKQHWANFNDAMEAALQDADKEWGAGRTDATVELEVDVETQSPGNIHEYLVILTPK